MGTVIGVDPTEQHVVIADVNDKDDPFRLEVDDARELSARLRRDLSDVGHTLVRVECLNGSFEFQASRDEVLEFINCLDEASALCDTFAGGGVRPPTFH